MKVAILSESPADEAALRILADALLGVRTQPVAPLALRSRGWPSVRTVLPTVIKHLHYQTDAGGLIVVVDSDDSAVHANRSDGGACDPRCRLCELRRVASLASGGLREVPGRRRLGLAIGLAVPAIEAWYLCGADPHVNEATWSRSLGERRKPYTRPKLKERVYGTERPSLAMETQRAEEEAGRLAEKLHLLKDGFPNGFGALAADLDGWGLRG